jgi:ribose-phosphate pyrophosphokinase
MLKVNNIDVNIKHFPDGTLLLKQDFGVNTNEPIVIEWLFDNNEELVTLIFLTKHLRSLGHKDISLFLPYIPNARQDRVKNDEDVFTLKYFADTINWLEFSCVYVCDPHSSVSEALINNIYVKSPKDFIDKVLDEITDITENNFMLFYPDEGAMKRYSGMINKPYAFGIKNRDWNTGEIKGLDVSGMKELIPNNNILIVDDICSRGGTFYHSAKKLKELGANKVFLYVTHCENTIFDGEILNGDLVDKVYTTDSILRNHRFITGKIKIFNV